MIAQLFVPPFIGIADNGDLGKVAGHLSLAPADGGASNFLYFQPDYTRAVRHYWDSPYTSSEIILAWIALHISGATGKAIDSIYAGWAPFTQLFSRQLWLCS